MACQLDCFAADLDPGDGSLPARRLSEAEVRAVVERALRGDGTLIELMDIALFGRHTDRGDVTWGDWPDHAIEAWDMATGLFRDRSRAREEAIQERDALVRRELAWECVEAAIPPGSVFPALPHVRNHEIPRPTDVTTKAFMRELIEKQCWTFAGRGRSRRVVLAPCVACGTVARPRELKGRLCPECAGGA